MTDIEEETQDFMANIDDYIGNIRESIEIKTKSAIDYMLKAYGCMREKLYRSKATDFLLLIEKYGLYGAVTFNVTKKQLNCKLSSIAFLLMCALTYLKHIHDTKDMLLKIINSKDYHTYKHTHITKLLKNLDVLGRIVTNEISDDNGNFKGERWLNNISKLKPQQKMSEIIKLVSSVLDLDMHYCQAYKKYSSTINKYKEEYASKWLNYKEGFNKAFVSFFKTKKGKTTSYQVYVFFTKNQYIKKPLTSINPSDMALSFFHNEFNVQQFITNQEVQLKIAEYLKNCEYSYKKLNRKAIRIIFQPISIVLIDLKYLCNIDYTFQCYSEEKQTGTEFVLNYHTEDDKALIKEKAKALPLPEKNEPKISSLILPFTKFIVPLRCCSEKVNLAAATFPINDLQPIGTYKIGQRD